MGTAVAVGLGTSILEPSFKFEAFDHSGITEPWHPDDCATCHSDTVDSWNDTWHSDFVGVKLVVNETHVIRYGNSPFMPPTVWTLDEFAAEGGCCMVTRWENTTLPADVNASGSFWDYGITCAACHDEPGVVDDDSSVCSGCHVPGGNQYANWAKSAHASSLDDLLASGHASNYCLHCMAGQTTYQNLTGVDPTDPSLGNIGCATCHDVHDASLNWDQESAKMGPNGAQLRAETTNDLCGTCHTQFEFLTDAGGDSQHSSLSCTDCHGYRWIPEHNSTDRFGNPTVVAAGFASLNHTWEFSPFPEACSLCHEDTNTSTIVNATAVWTAMQGYVGDVEDLVTLYDAKLENVSAKVDEANETKGVDQTEVDNAYALLDEADDLSDAIDMAFHNPTLAKQKLQLALTKLDQAYTTAVDAIDGAKSAPGFGWIVVFPVFGLIAIIARKKQR
ncbi:MAG: multiheme c-type cytochrome [Candidatus Hodarchaeales archaeon]